MKYILIFVLGFICIHSVMLVGQNLEVVPSGQLKHTLSESELNAVQLSSNKLFSEYLTKGDLLDPEQKRITNKSIEDFKGLFTSESSLFIDFMGTGQVQNVEGYIQLARTYYEKEGIPFDLEKPELISVAYEKECDCYRAVINIRKTIYHYYDKGSWEYDKKDMLLEFELRIKEDFTNYKIASIRPGMKPKVPQFSQHTLSLLGGASNIGGAEPQTVNISSPYTVGLSYQYIKPLHFLGQSISGVIGTQLRFSQIKTSVSEGLQISVDENPVDNSITRINFLTNGVEEMSVLSIEPQIGLDIQIMERENRQIGAMALISSRFSIRASGTYTGAVAYEETFNERVTVSNIINCGLRDFAGADAVDASYSTSIFQAGLGISISPYYQFVSGNRRGWRIGLDFQYFLPEIFASGGRFLGNYNDAFNSALSNNPNSNLNGGSLVQTVSQNSSEFYIGLRVGHYLRIN